MLITLTSFTGEAIEVNPNHIVLVEQVGGDRPHTKLSLVTREQVQVRESREAIRELCNPTIAVTALETFSPGPTEVKATDAVVEAIADSIVSNRKRK